MSGRTAAALCLVAFFATAPAPWDWMTAAWNALAATIEDSASVPDEEPDVEPGGKDEGWLIDPNG